MPKFVIDCGHLRFVAFVCPYARMAVLWLHAMSLNQRNLALSCLLKTALLDAEVVHGYRRHPRLDGPCAFLGRHIVNIALIPPARTKLFSFLRACA